jgi:hypothetical protein
LTCAALHRLTKTVPRPSSRSTSSKVCLDRSGEGRIHGGRMLSGVAGVAERVLRVAAAAGVGTRHSGSAAARADPCLACREPRALWATARLEGPARGWLGPFGAVPSIYPFSLSVTDAQQLGRSAPRQRPRLDALHHPHPPQLARTHCRPPQSATSLVASLRGHF